MRFKIARAVLIALLSTGAYLGVALLSSSPASAATSLWSDSVTSAPTAPATDGVGGMDAELWQGAGRRIRGLSGMFSVPAHLRSAARVERRAVRV